MRRPFLAVYILFVLFCFMPGLASSQQDDASHSGTVLSIEGQTIRVAIPDTITVEPGVSGRIIQERTIAGKVREIRAALLETVRVERASDAPWIVVCQITKRTQPLAPGDRVVFESVFPRPATIAVHSQPEGAQIYVNGARVGPAPIRQEVTSGRHVIRLEKDEYQPAEKTIRLAAGEKRHLSITLARQVGILSVNSEPTGAAVSIKGQDIGRTPLTKELEPGTYQVRLEREGFQVETENIRVTSDKEARVNVALRRPLNIRLSPTQSALVDHTSLAREEGQLIIRYDLIGDEDKYEVQLHLSTDGGQSYSPLPKTISGAIGKDIEPGTGKQIVWAALSDFPRGFEGEDNLIRLTVEKHGRRGLLWVIGGALAAGAGATVGLLMSGGGGDESAGDNTSPSPSGIPTPPAPPN